MKSVKKSTFEAHQVGSEFLVALSDRLVAVWNSQPARGYSGTADVVAYAQCVGVPVTILCPKVPRGAHADLLRDQGVMLLVWMAGGETFTQLGAHFGTSTDTAWCYLRMGLDVLADVAPTPEEALGVRTPRKAPKGPGHTGREKAANSVHAQLRSAVE